MTDIAFPYQGLSESAPHLGGYVTNYEMTGTWAPNVLFELHQKIKPKTVTDIGCGAGHVGQWFRDRGCAVVGIDGVHDPNVQFDVIRHDYERDGPLMLDDIRDLAVSFEFVEHVEKACMPNWMRTVRCHRWFAMTHATPGQQGHHHVNCQLPSFWMSYMQANGFRLDVEFSLDMRASLNRFNDAARCIKNSFLLFEQVDFSP